MVFEGEFYKHKELTGKIKEYSFDDELEFEGEYLYGKKHGYGKEYYKGKLEFEGEYYYNEKWKGKEYKYNYESKELEREYEYLLGKKNGKALEYFEDGKIKFEGEYINGLKWNGKGYDSDGNLVYEIKNGIKTEKEYSEQKNSSKGLPKLICNFEEGNDAQKNYCIELRDNYTHDKMVTYEIKSCLNATFSIELNLNGNVYQIQNNFNESEMKKEMQNSLIKIYKLLDEEDKDLE